MALLYIPNHGDYAVARLSEQYKDAPSMVALMRAIAVEHQNTEDIVIQLYGSTIENASGHELDVIGTIVGQARKGKSDEVYRIWVRARMMANRSTGTGEELLAIVYMVTRGLVPIIISEIFPAGVVVQLGAATFIDASEVAELLQSARAAAIDLTVTNDMSVDAVAFAFDPNGAGWGDNTDTDAGGKFA